MNEDPGTRNGIRGGATAGSHRRKALISLAVRVVSGVCVFLGFAILLLVGGAVIAWVTYSLFRA